MVLFDGGRLPVSVQRSQRLPPYGDRLLPLKARLSQGVAALQAMRRKPAAQEMYTTRFMMASTWDRFFRAETLATSIWALRHRLRRHRIVLVRWLADDLMGDDTSNVIRGGFFFSAVIQGRDITVQLPPRVQTALAGLPPHSRAFTGREEALHQVLQVLDPANRDAGRAQVSVISGLGGVGKTELALQAAHSAFAKGWFPGGVLLVDLFGYDPQRRVEPVTALDGLLRAVGIAGDHIPAAQQDRSRLFSSVIAAYAAHGQDVLVIIDNAASSAQVRPLLPGTGHVLVTSRHTLADLESRLWELDVLTPDAAVELLARRLDLALGGIDTRVTSHPDDAARVAGMCGRLPLALQLVAAQLAGHRSRPLEAMAAELTDASTRLREISYGSVGVQTAFDLSYQHLDASQADLFRLLTVNLGSGISTEASAVLADLKVDEARRALDDLASAHLVERGSVYGRWRMHDLIRLYAEQRSHAEVDADRRRAALFRLLDYYLSGADDACAYLDDTEVIDPAETRFPDRTEALAWLDTEYPNLIAAAHAAAAHDHHAVARDLPFALRGFLHWGRHIEDLVSLASIAVTATRHLDDKSGEAAALAMLGEGLQEARGFDEAIAACQEAVTIARQLEARQIEVVALSTLGIALREARRFDEAITICQEAVTIAKQIGDRDAEGTALNALGNSLGEVRRFDEAIAALERDLEINREAGDRINEAGALINIGLILVDLRRFDEAIGVYTDAATVLRQIGDRYGTAKAVDNLGVALRSRGRFDEAIAACREAVAIYRELGDPHGEGRALLNLAPALHRARQVDEALSVCQDATALGRETGDQYLEATALGNLGAMLFERGQVDEAIAASHDAVAMYRRIDDKAGEAMALANLGGTLRRAGRSDEAIASCESASAIYEQIGDQHGKAMAKHNLGLALKSVRRSNEAILALLDAASLFRETGDIGGEVKSLIEVGALLRSKRRFRQAFSIFRIAFRIALMSRKSGNAKTVPQRYRSMLSASIDESAQQRASAEDPGPEDQMPDLKPSPVKILEEDIKPNHGGYQHYISKRTISQFIPARNPVVALCGWKWIPQRSQQAGDNLSHLPVCPICKERYNALPHH
jgi:tetratricopeptide (TPR) repeat protein